MTSFPVLQQFTFPELTSYIFGCLCRLYYVTVLVVQNLRERRKERGRREREREGRESTAYKGECWHVGEGN